MANEFKVGDLVRHVHWDLYGIIVPSEPPAQIVPEINDLL